MERVEQLEQPITEENPGAMGLIPAMADVIGDPPGWPTSSTIAPLRAPLDVDFDVWPDGPDWAGGPRRVDVQGLGSPRCPNTDCPSNGGKPPESGVFPRGMDEDE